MGTNHHDPSRIILPPGSHARPHQEHISASEMMKFAAMQELATRLGISVVCRSCDHAFTGQNGVNDPELVISCRCRQIRSPNPRVTG